jgi:phage terminase large subunit-like protein
MIFDDILTDNIMFSKDERAKLKSWYFSSVVPAGDTSHCKKIVVGTPMTDDDLLSEMLRNPMYKSIKFPIANEFPVPEKDIVSSWKDYHTPERIMKAYLEAKGMGAEGDFFREKMLEVVNDEMRIFTQDNFVEYKYIDLKESETMNKMHFFTTMDLAVSSKKHADFTVLITIGVSTEGHWYIVKIDVGRFNPTQTIDILFEHVKKFRPMNVRAEKASLQQVLDHFIQLRMMKDNTYFAYEGLENNSVLSKEYRINSLQPLMKMKKIHFPTDIDIDSMAELLYEMKGYIKTGATTAHDDAVDCLANFLDPNFVIVPTGDKATEHDGGGNFDDLFEDYETDTYDY